MAEKTFKELLDEFHSDIANAIREKAGIADTEEQKIKPENFAGRIRALPTGEIPGIEIFNNGTTVKITGSSYDTVRFESTNNIYDIVGTYKTFNMNTNNAVYDISGATGAVVIRDNLANNHIFNIEGAIITDELKAKIKAGETVFGIQGEYSADSIPGVALVSSKIYIDFEDLTVDEINVSNTANPNKKMVFDSNNTDANISYAGENVNLDFTGASGIIKLSGLEEDTQEIKFADKLTGEKLSFSNPYSTAKLVSNYSTFDVDSTKITLDISKAKGVSLIDTGMVEDNVIATNLESGNIKDGVTILGKLGTYKGQSFNAITKEIAPSTVYQIVNPKDYGADYFSEVYIKAVDASIDADIIAKNIKVGATILGVDGTYEGIPVEFVNGTAINASGIVPTIYINQNISISGMNSIFSQLTYDSDIYRVATTADMTSFIHIVRTASGDSYTYKIVILDNSTPVTFEDSYTFKTTFQSVSPLEIMNQQISVGEQNDLLSSIISTTPFTVEGMKEELPTQYISASAQESVEVSAETFDYDSDKYTLSKVVVNQVTSEIDSNIQGHYILEGVTILGVPGTLKPTTETAIEGVSVNDENKLTIDNNVGFYPLIYIDTSLKTGTNIDIKSISSTINNDATSSTINVSGSSNNVIINEAIAATIDVSSTKGSDNKIIDNLTNSHTYSIINAENENVLVSSNIRSGVTILGVPGNYVGTEINPQTLTVNPSKETQTIYPYEGYAITEVIVNPVTSAIDSNIKPSNIVSGVTILGVPGEAQINLPEIAGVTIDGANKLTVDYSAEGREFTNLYINGDGQYVSKELHNTSGETTFTTDASNPVVPSIVIATGEGNTANLRYSSGIVNVVDILGEPVEDFAAENIASGKTFLGLTGKGLLVKNDDNLERVNLSFNENGNYDISLAQNGSIMVNVSVYADVEQTTIPNVDFDEEYGYLYVGRQENGDVYTIAPTDDVSIKILSHDIGLSYPSGVGKYVATNLEEYNIMHGVDILGCVGTNKGNLPFAIATEADMDALKTDPLVTDGQFFLYQGESNEKYDNETIYCWSELNSRFDRIDVGNKLVAQIISDTLEGHVIIPTETTRIRSDIFRDKKNIYRVSFEDVLNNKCTEIAEYAFSGCTNLDVDNFPNVIKTIGDGAFENCSANLHIGTILNKASLESIGGSAFKGCTYLESIELDKTKITSIYAYTFYNCENLSSITMPDSVTTIENSAFEGCTSLTDIPTSSSLTTIGDRAFADSGLVGNITIPETVTTVGKNAFEGTNVVRFIIPKAIDASTLGQEAFGNLTVEAMSFNGSLSDWVSKNWNSVLKHPTGGVTDHRVKLFIGNEELTQLITQGLVDTNYNLPITSIKDYAFANVSSLGWVDTSGLVGTSQSGTEYYITRIGRQAFENCENITNVIIGENVTNIGDNAFYWSITSSINRLSIKFKSSTPPSCGSTPFGPVAENRIILVPTGSLEAYKTATNLAYYADVMEEYSE